MSAAQPLATDTPPSSGEPCSPTAQRSISPPVMVSGRSRRASAAAATSASDSRTQRPWLCTSGAACLASARISVAVSSTSSNSTDHRTRARSAADVWGRSSTVVRRRLGLGALPTRGICTSKPALSRAAPTSDMRCQASSSLRMASPRHCEPARRSSGMRCSARSSSRPMRARILVLGCAPMAFSTGSSTPSGSSASTCRAQARDESGGSSRMTSFEPSGSVTGRAHWSSPRTRSWPRSTGALNGVPSRHAR